MTRFIIGKKPKRHGGEKLTDMKTIKELQELCHQIATEKGFWEAGDRNDGELIALMHSELSEALEALRKDDWDNVAEELADVVIRIMDFCEAREINLQQQILMKIEKNKVRPHKHGKKF